MRSGINIDRLNGSCRGIVGSLRQRDWRRRCANWKALYSSNGLPGTSNANPDQIDLALRGVAWGDAVGVALANDLGPLKAQATNFLMDAAQGIPSYGASLVGQPVHHPFQGELLT
jgi:hypothetical protein